MNQYRKQLCGMNRLFRKEDLEEVVRVQTYPYFLHIVQSVKEGREYPETSPNSG